jgi:hypothetical protein
MSISWRGLVISTLIVLVSVVIAIPAHAQSSSALTRQSLVAGVKFDGSAPRLPAEQGVQQISTDDHGIGVGVLAGVIRTSLSGEDNEGNAVEDFFESRTGTMFGAWVGGNMNGRIGFTGEFIYLIRKSDISFDDDGLIDDELSYPAFSIPAVFHVNFGGQDRSKGLFYVVGGPVFTFNLKQKVKIDGEGESIDLSDDFNGTDIGVVAGAGFEIFRIAFEVRHNWGLRSITDTGDIGDLKTRTWDFLVKFRFN